MVRLSPQGVAREEPWMLQLIYSSAAVTPFSQADLNKLLDLACRRNDLFCVTGMLLYHSGSFLQVLEGPESGIDTIYRSITRDKRHINHKLLNRSEVTRREFEGWSMGFADTSTVRRPEGFVDYNRVLPKMGDAATVARKYLGFFQQGLCRQSSVR